MRVEGGDDLLERGEGTKKREVEEEDIDFSFFVLRKEASSTFDGLIPIVLNPLCSFPLCL